MEIDARVEMKRYMSFTKEELAAKLIVIKEDYTNLKQSIMEASIPQFLCFRKQLRKWSKL